MQKKFTNFVNLFYHNVDMIFMKFSVDNQRLSTYLFIRYKLVFYLINRLSSSTTSTIFVFQKFTIFVNQFCHFFIYISTPGSIFYHMGDNIVPRNFFQ